MYCPSAFALLMGLFSMVPVAAEPATSGSHSPSQNHVSVEHHGEYVGCLTQADGSRARVGLQIVALGNDEFRAAEFAGGLPGNRGELRPRVHLSGRLQEGSAVLGSDNRTYSCDGWNVTVIDAAGRTLGTLGRVRRESRFLNACPPSCATVLFDGRDTGELKNARISSEGLLQVGCETARAYRDFLLHVEFQTPFMPAARGQARGNSGVYLQGRYEVQILDSFGLAGANNECGGLYKQREPLLNMCFPPQAWQSYDIDFTAARFDAAGKKCANARLTVWHNGIIIHKNAELTDKTGAGAAEGPDPRPIKFQDHGDPVQFRNLWIVDRNPGPQVATPPTPIR